MLVRIVVILLTACSFVDPLGAEQGGPAGVISAANYPSIQAALDANPNRMILVPAGDHVISEKLRLRGVGAGLSGSGRIIQKNNEHPVIEIENGAEIEIRDVTLTRTQGTTETHNEGILAIRCHDLVIDHVKVIDNHTNSGAISLRECQRSRISHCLIRNYMRISVDDRTHSPEWGYAFQCTDGTGISVGACTGTLIESNTIIEERLRPTPEVKAQHRLGEFVKKNPVKGTLMSQQAWDAGATDNWQQGSAIVVTSPQVSDLTRVIGNHIENAAQGIDLHSDHVIVSSNIVVNSFIGMKAMHGSANVLIIGNQFVRNSLWAIGLMPGVASSEENRDGGSIIANNIISQFGEGDAKWIWGEDRFPIRFDRGQQLDDPPLTDVLVSGNVIHSFGSPRYKYAVLIEDPQGPRGPKGLHFQGNLFPAGREGVSNTELAP